MSHVVAVEVPVLTLLLKGLQFLLLLLDQSFSRPHPGMPKRHASARKELELQKWDYYIILFLGFKTKAMLSIDFTRRHHRIIVALG